MLFEKWLQNKLTLVEVYLYEQNSLRGASLTLINKLGRNWYTCIKLGIRLSRKTCILALRISYKRYYFGQNDACTAKPTFHRTLQGELSGAELCKVQKPRCKSCPGGVVIFPVPWPFLRNGTRGFCWSISLESGPPQSGRPIYFVYCSAGDREWWMASLDLQH